MQKKNKKSAINPWQIQDPVKRLQALFNKGFMTSKEYYQELRKLQIGEYEHEYKVYPYYTSESSYLEKSYESSLGDQVASLYGEWRY